MKILKVILSGVIAVVLVTPSLAYHSNGKASEKIMKCDNSTPHNCE